jgi:steroid delta-isomerase-like uncharacterized protein
MSEVNKALIRRWYEEVWNKGRTEAIDEMFADDVITHGLADESGIPVQGAAGFKEFHRKFKAAFPDLTITVEDTIAEGDKVVARCTVRGRHVGDSLGLAATDKPIEITGISITRIQDGKIVEGWNNFDFMSLFQQIGAI